jgi:hypothetical protein
MAIAALLYMAGEVMHSGGLKPMRIVICGFEILWLRMYLDYEFLPTDIHVI